MKPWEKYSSTETSPKPWEKYKKTEEPTENALDSMMSYSKMGADTFGTKDPLDTQPKETVNPNGTISTLTTGQPEDYQGAFNENVTEPLVEGAGQTVAGMRKPIAGTAKAINDTVDATLGTNLGKDSDRAIKQLNEYTDKYNQEHPDQTIHPSTVGELITFGLTPVGKGAMVGGASIGALSFVDALGNNKDYNKAAVDAVAGAVLGGASIGVLNKLFPPEASGELSKQAQLLLKLNQGRISEKEAIKLLKGISKEDQAISLAESLDLAKKYFGKAVGDDSRMAAKLGARLEQRKNIIEPFIANEQDLAQARQTFSNMRYTIDKEAKAQMATSGLAQDIDKLAEVYATDPAGLGTAIKQIKLDLSETMSAGQALDIRENINMLLRKPAIKKSFKAKEILSNIKSKVDDFIEKAVTPEQKALIDKEISKYRETINDYQLSKILDKHTKADYAVDWEAVLNEARKEGLGSKNVDMVIPILKEFSKKFHNDKYLAEAITPKGSNQIHALGVWSKLIGEVLDFVSPVFNRSRYKDIQIVKAIRGSINKSETPLGFVEDLVKRNLITKEQANPLIDEIKLIEHKPEAKTTGDVNLNPKYGTPKGTISNDASEAALHDAQKQILQEALGKGYTDEVAQKAIKIINSKRVNSVLQNTAAKMKADDAIGNRKMLEKLINSETDKIIQRMQKDLGIKIPKSEAEKIYKMKIKELLKDC